MDSTFISLQQYEHDLTTDQVLLAPDQVVFDDLILGNISL